MARPLPLGLGRLLAAGSTLALVLSAAGCSGSVFGTDPMVWTDRVCASLVPLVQANQSRPAVDPKDFAATQRALSASLAAGADAVPKVLAGLDEAGSSPIPGGDDAVAQLRDLATQLKVTMLDVKIELDATNPAATDAFIAVLAEALDARATLTAGVEQAQRIVAANPEVRAAALTAASCRQVGLGGAAVGSASAVPSSAAPSGAPPGIPPSR